MCSRCSDSIAYAAEPVFASLANLMGIYERLPSNVPSEIKVSQRDETARLKCGGDYSTTTDANRCGSVWIWL